MTVCMYEYIVQCSQTGSGSYTVVFCRYRGSFLGVKRTERDGLIMTFILY
jgi:hypothetical protein